MNSEHVPFPTLKDGFLDERNTDDYLVLLSHRKSLLSDWDHLQRVRDGKQDVTIDGQSLRMADVVAVSQYVAPVLGLVRQRAE